MDRRDPRTSRTERRLAWPGCATALAALSWPCSSSAASTYSANVAPILEEHCVTCHRPGGSMPAVPLDTYQAAKASARAALAQIKRGAMPPWFADPAQSVPFRNDPRLKAEELRALENWIAAGMPPGSAAGANAPNRTLWGHPQGRPPDAVVSLPRIDLAAEGELPYIRELIQVTLPHDRWISALQPLAGNPAVVHHMGIAEVTLPRGMTAQKVRELETVARQAGLPEGAFVKSAPSITDPNDPDTYDMLAAFTPGGGFESYPPGAGKLLRAGPDQYISFNIHYTTTGRPESDESKLGLWFSDRPPPQQLLRAPMPGKTLIANGQELLSDAPGTRAEGTQFAVPPIAALDGDYVLTGVTALLRPMTVYALQPHAHMRAVSFRYRAVWPDGHEQSLLSIPDYDFHWQRTYELREPLTLPAGSKLIVSARYDNSPRNRRLLAAVLADPAKRCSPEKLVYFRQQNQIWDEMFSPIVEYAAAAGTQAGTVRLVRATGCITRAVAGRWQLSRVGRLEPAASQSSSGAELSELSRWPLGTQVLEIAAAPPFDLQHELGQRVAVKAMALDAGGNTRLSLTSVQKISGDCH